MPLPVHKGKKNTVCVCVFITTHNIITGICVTDELAYSASAVTITLRFN